MFQINHSFEQLITRIEKQPATRKTLSLAVQKQLDDYVELKRQSELPPGEKPLRRALMTNEEKAAFIAKKGRDRYLSLPY